MILKFQGIVKEYDLALASENIYTIGGVDFIHEINAAGFDGLVTVAVADQSFSGDLDCWEGSAGYSEYTPGEVPELSIGSHNILEIIERHVSQSITLWVADEPINTLED
jgi:hypothetical protein